MILALKQLLRRPVYFLALVLVMAMGLGGAVSLYAIADAVLFQPLRVQDSDTLVRVFQTNETRTARNGWSLPQIKEDLRAVEAFAGVAHFYDHATYTWSAGSEVRETLAGGVASGNFFELLGIKPFLGRLLQPADDIRGGPVVGVLSFEAWQSRFAANSQIIGENITLNDRLVTIVGVTLPGFSGVSLSRRPDVWLPVSSAAGIAMGASDESRFLDARTLHWLDVVARLKQGITVEQARRAMDAAQFISGENEVYPAAALAIPAREVALNRYGEGDTAHLSWLLLGLVCVLLMIVCADVAGLMLVRAETQRAETGLRMSLGASRRRIAMNVLGEAFVISVLAGAFGLCLRWRCRADCSRR